MISVQGFLCAELVASAVLALWLVSRFPKVGPSSIRTASALCLGSVALFQPLPFVVRLLAGLPYGAYVALFGCVLPELLFGFVVAAWLMRSCARAFGGSGGGPGIAVPTSSR